MLGLQSSVVLSNLQLILLCFAAWLRLSVISKSTSDTVATFVMSMTDGQAVTRFHSLDVRRASENPDVQTQSPPPPPLSPFLGPEGQYRPSFRPTVACSIVGAPVEKRRRTTFERHSFCRGVLEIASGEANTKSNQISALN